MCVSIVDTGADMYLNKERVRDTSVIGINITVFYCKVIFDGRGRGRMINLDIRWVCPTTTRYYPSLELPIVCPQSGRLYPHVNLHYFDHTTALYTSTHPL